MPNFSPSDAHLGGRDRQRLNRSSDCRRGGQSGGISRSCSDRGCQRRRPDTASRLNFAFFPNRLRAEDVTIFTRDLALLFKAGARLDAALELLTNDMDIGRLHPFVGERQRGETLRRKLSEAPRYPAFVLFAASCVLTLFLLFVLPQFDSVLRGFRAKLDPIVVFFLGLSDLVRSHSDMIAVFFAVGLSAAWLMGGRADVQRAMSNTMARHRS
jgi:general secretion pathway protein F